MHCSCNDLEISRTYGSTQTSTSRMLRERLVCGTPCAHIIVLTLTTTQIFSSVVERASLHG